MGPGYCPHLGRSSVASPATAVIAALGIIYGSLIGGLLGSLGLITGGLLGYGLMLTAARRFAQRLAGPRSLHKMESWLVEPASAGFRRLAGMPMRKFTAA